MLLSQALTSSSKVTIFSLARTATASLCVFLSWRRIGSMSAPDSICWSRLAAMSGSMFRRSSSERLVTDLRVVGTKYSMGSALLLPEACLPLLSLVGGRSRLSVRWLGREGGRATRASLEGGGMARTGTFGGCPGSRGDGVGVSSSVAPFTTVGGLAGKFGRYVVLASWMRREVSREESLEAVCQEGRWGAGVEREESRELMDACSRWSTMDTRATPSRM